MSGESPAWTLRIRERARRALRSVRTRASGRGIAAPGALLVYPRLVRLGPPFHRVGARSHDGQRLLLRRPAGFEVAQRARIRTGRVPAPACTGLPRAPQSADVKELEDSPRDEIAVLLDCDARAVVGESFDVQVRVAGSILTPTAARRRGVLCQFGAARGSHVTLQPRTGVARSSYSRPSSDGDTPVARLPLKRTPCSRASSWWS